MAKTTPAGQVKPKEFDFRGPGNRAAVVKKIKITVFPPAGKIDSMTFLWADSLLPILAPLLNFPQGILKMGSTPINIVVNAVNKYVTRIHNALYRELDSFEEVRQKDREKDRAKYRAL